MGTLDFGLPAGLNKLLRTKVNEDKNKTGNDLILHDRFFDFYRSSGFFRFLK